MSDTQQIKRQSTQVMTRHGNDLESLSEQCVVLSKINRRDKNEDSRLVFSLTPGGNQPPIQVLAVADGMGGHDHGEDVSREGLRRLSHALFDSLVVEPSLNHNTAPPITLEQLAQAVQSALEQTNVNVRRMIEVNKWRKAGSTLVSVAIFGDEAVATNLGDSPLFHFQARAQKLVQVTENHSVAGILLQGGQITPEMARVHEGRSQLEYYLGASKIPRTPPIYRLSLASDDILLLCSDGISGMLTEAEIAEILGSGETLTDMAERLLAKALEAGETDNQTLILWRHVSRNPKSETTKTMTFGSPVVPSSTR